MEKWKNTLTVLLTVLASVLLLRVFFSSVLPVLLPFLIGLFAVLLCLPAAKRVAARLHLRQKSVLLLFSVLFVSAVLLGTGALLFCLFAEAWSFLSSVGAENIIAVFDRIAGPFERLFSAVDGSDALRDTMLSAVNGMLSRTMSRFGEWVTSVAKALPGALLFLVTVLISTVYFALGSDEMRTRWFLRLPKRAQRLLAEIRFGFFDTAGKYARSYLILMLFEFLWMLCGFLLLRVRYALLLAALVALLDALPVIGVGTVLVPWAIFSFLSGERALGIGLLVLFLTSELVRQLIEPKIVGHTVGIPPLLTLLLLYASYTVFGIGGLLLLPFFSVAARYALTKLEKPGKNPRKVLKKAENTQGKPKNAPTNSG